MCMLPQAARLEQQQQRDQDEQQQQLEVPAGKIVLTMKPVPVSEAACRTLLLAAGYGPKEGSCHSCAVVLCHPEVTCDAAEKARLSLQSCAACRKM